MRPISTISVNRRRPPGGGGGSSGPWPNPSYRISLPPNQMPSSGPASNAIAYQNIGSSGSNSPISGQNLRTIDTYVDIDWWFVIQMRFPNEWPWNTLGGPNSFFDIFNPHLIGLDPMWANQAWFTVSPLILQVNNGYWTSAGKVSLLFMLEQWDGLRHFPETGFPNNPAHVPHVADLAMDTVHDVLIHMRAGSYSLPSFSRLSNPRPSALQTTGLLQAWINDDIFSAPNSPTFDSDAFAVTAGQVLDGVSHISTDRVCRNPADNTFWSQRYWGFYEQGYCGTWSSPTNTLHFDLRMMSMGKSLAAAYAETFGSTFNVDHSVWNGSGTNFGPASFALTPDTWAHPRVPTVLGA